MKNTTKKLVSFSGGLDSTTLLARAINLGGEIHAVGFCYGSKHNKYENAAAEQIARDYGVPFRLIDLSPIMQNFRSDLLSSGGEVPEGYYEGENMRKTVVPARNIIFASVLTGIAESEDFREVHMGVHAGDHFIYPDCRPHCITALQAALYAGTDGKVSLQTPYLNATKLDIIADGMQLNVPYHLTRTCYKDQPIACGKCGSCQERLASFAALGLVDPIEYETRELIAQ